MTAGAGTWATGLRVLATGPLTAGSTCEMRRATFERNGASTAAVSLLPIFRSYPSILRKAQWFLRAGPAVERYNGDLSELIDRFEPTILWVEKGVFVRPKALRQAKARGAIVVLYSPDNYFLAQNNSRHLWRGLSLYDLVVTTKHGAEAALRARGAARVELSGNAYDTELHRPVELRERAEQERFGADVAFIGRWEPEREEWLETIANDGHKVAVWGGNWHRASSRAVKQLWRGPAEGLDYSRAINGAAITLCFLSRLARDSITQRSVEIPACGGFMLAERSDAHMDHFHADREAVFFTGLEELRVKIDYYLRHPDARREIAAAGRLRCETGGYSYDARLREILRACGLVDGFALEQRS